MSNWKHAYGWSGHILISKADGDSDTDDNVVAIPDPAFLRLLNDCHNSKLDPRIQVERLGVLDSDTCFLAAGCCFSEAFTHYGTIFLEAEVRGEGQPLADDRDGDYLKAMKEIYGIELPPCRLMIGCSTEH